jgi:hypothetical protein
LWRALEIDVDPNATLCTCPHTDRRRRAWSKAIATQGGSVARDAREAFASDAARDDLEALMAAQRATPARLKSTFVDVPDGQPLLVRHRTLLNAVDIYGLSVPDRARERSPSWRDEAFAFDTVRSASGDKGWLVMTAEGSQSRLSTWSAWARGARGVFFGPWRSSNGRAGGLVDADGTLTERASIAGALARVIGRNTALFAPLRPRGSAVAIAVDDDGSGERASFVYRVLLDRNIQADVIHVSQIAEGAAERYRVVVDTAVERRPSLLAALSAYAKAGGIVSRVDSAATPDALLQALARADVKPDVRIDGSSGGIETRFLESGSVVMFIALNHSETPQRVRFQFAPDTQEAIWQNMETGTSVNFVAGRDGPTYTYAFGARDALVLMIRKHMR